MKIDDEVLEEVHEQLRITYNKDWRDNNELVISIVGIKGDNLYTFNVPVAHLDESVINLEPEDIDRYHVPIVGSNTDDN